MESQVAQPIEEVVNTIEGIEELRSINGSGVRVRRRHVRSEPRHRRRRRRTCATGWPPWCGICRATPTRRRSPSPTRTSRPILTLALSGDRSQRELTEIADKIVKTQIERSAGVGEVDLIGGPGARDQRVGGRRPAGRLPDSHHRGARRGGAPERQHPGRQRHRRPARGDAAHDGAADRRAGVQRPGDRDAQRLADPRARHRLGGGRHEGAALHFAAQRRADGGAGGAAAVGREHRGGDRRRQGEAARAGSRSCPPT